MTGPESGVRPPSETGLPSSTDLLTVPGLHGESRQGTVRE